MSSHPNSLANLRPWPKGVSGNAGGLRKLPEGLRGILSLSRLEVTKLVSKYARMSFHELCEAKTNPKTTVLDLSVIAIFEKSASEGDSKGLSFLLEQALGRLPTTILDHEEDKEREELGKLSLQQLLRLAQNSLTDATE